VRCAVTLKIEKKICAVAKKLMPMLWPFNAMSVIVQSYQKLVVQSLSGYGRKVGRRVSANSQIYATPPIIIL
jgi:hypothetical protein